LNPVGLIGHGPLMTHEEVNYIVRRHPQSVAPGKDRQSLLKRFGPCPGAHAASDVQKGNGPQFAARDRLDEAWPVGAGNIAGVVSHDRTSPAGPLRRASIAFNS